MSTHWIAVVNKERARFFTSNAALDTPEEVLVLFDPKARLHERELVTDDRGRGNTPGPGRHGVREIGRVREAETEDFAGEVAEAIETARKRSEFDKLHLVAAPQMLGTLRNKLSKPTLSMVFETLDKDLANEEPASIFERLTPATITDDSVLTGR